MVMYQMGITYVPENRRLFTHLSVEENLEIADRGYVIQTGDLVMGGRVMNSSDQIWSRGHSWVCDNGLWEW
jgi:ABC-type branched-subunit amino acid transport system ATPase component